MTKQCVIIKSQDQHILTPNDLTGGIRDNKPVSDVFIYYPYSNKWCPANPLNQQRYHHACVLVNNNIYVIGELVYNLQFTAGVHDLFAIVASITDFISLTATSETY